MLTDFEFFIATLPDWDGKWNKNHRNRNGSGLSLGINGIRTSDFVHQPHQLLLHKYRHQTAVRSSVRRGKRIELYLFKQN